MKDCSQKFTSAKLITPGTNQAILPMKKQEHVAFLYDMFETPAGQAVKLSRTTFAGRFITALRQYSKVPRKTEFPEGYPFSVVVEFPNNSLSHADERFNYFSYEYAEQINDFVQATFDLFFHVYFFDLSAMPKIGCDETSEEAVTKLHLVDSFIAGLNLIDMGSATETIKKREYRKEIELLSRKRKVLLQKERRFRFEIYKKRKEYIQSILNQ
jgi:hypothetical protein